MNPIASSLSRALIPCWYWVVGKNHVLKMYMIFKRIKKKVVIHSLNDFLVEIIKP